MTVWPVQVVGVDAAEVSQALMHVWGASTVASTVTDRLGGCASPSTLT